MTRLIFFIFILLLARPGKSFAQENRTQEELKNIREDIVIINLLNNLDLKKEQMEFILQKAKAIEAIEKSALNKIAVSVPRMLDACGAIKKEVESGRVTVEKEEARDFTETKHGMEDIIKNRDTQIETKAEETEEILEDFQLIALDNYKPCIIPIMKDGRIGQSSGSKSIVKTLERVKNIPELRYAANKNEIINRLLERIKEKAPSLRIDEEKAREKILNVFGEIRTMDEVTFQIQKTSLAEELHKALLPEPPAMSRIAKIKKFLLSKNSIGILERRLKEVADSENPGYETFQ